MCPPKKILNVLSLKVTLYAKIKVHKIWTINVFPSQEKEVLTHPWQKKTAGSLILNQSGSAVHSRSYFFRLAFTIPFYLRGEIHPWLLPSWWACRWRCWVARTGPWPDSSQPGACHSSGTARSSSSRHGLRWGWWAIPWGRRPGGWHRGSSGRRWGGIRATRRRPTWERLGRESPGPQKKQLLRHRQSRHRREGDRTRWRC